MFSEHLGVLAMALLYVLSAFGWGGLISFAFKRPPRTFWSDIAAQFVMGCVTLYVLFLALSLGGWLHRIPVGIVIGLGTVISCAAIPDLARKAASTLTDVMNWDAGDRLLLAFVGLGATTQIVYGLTPLIFYDVQVYHLLAPAQFLMSGGLSHILWNVQTDTPLAAQLIVGMSLVLDSSGQVAKLIFALIGGLAAAGTYELIRPAGTRAALLAALFVLCYPEFWVIQMLGAVDLGIAGLMIFGLIWVRESLAEGSWKAAVFGGLAFGLAVGSRYQAVVLVSWILLVLTAEVSIWKRQLPERKAILQILAVGSLISLMVAPWLIRNYMHLGNPVFPFMQSIWGGGGEWSPAQTDAWNFGAFGPAFSTLSTVQKILSPIAALLVMPGNGLFGPCLLLGSLIGIILARREIQLASVLGLGGLVMWGLLKPGAGTALLRYNALSIIFLLAATGAMLGGQRIPRGLGTKIALVMAGGSLVVALMHMQGVFPAAQSLARADVRQAVYQANVPSWEAFDYINTKLDPQHSKVLFIGETRGFWLHVPFIAPSAYNGAQLSAIFDGNSEPDLWRERFSHLGVTHLLLSNSEIGLWHDKYGYLTLPPQQTEKLNRWLQTLPAVFSNDRGIAVLSLERASK